MMMTDGKRLVIFNFAKILKSGKSMTTEGIDISGNIIFANIFLPLNWNFPMAKAASAPKYTQNIIGITVTRRLFINNLGMSYA